jgi:hypothetical protein
MLHYIILEDRIYNVDSDFTGKLEKTKFTLDYVVIVARGDVSWVFKLQTVYSCFYS